MDKQDGEDETNNHDKKFGATRLSMFSHLAPNEKSCLVLASNRINMDK
jgi:hypothetical protein